MKNLDFEWLTDEFMLYCRSTQLREKTMSSYEQTLHLFGRWLSDELNIYTVDGEHSLGVVIHIPALLALFSIGLKLEVPQGGLSFFLHDF